MKELDKAIKALEEAKAKIDAMLSAGQEGVQICPKCNKMFWPPRDLYYGDPTVCSDCQGGGDSWSSSAQNNGLKTADDAQNNGKRWFVNTSRHIGENGRVLECEFGKKAKWITQGICKSSEMVCDGYSDRIAMAYMEVQESDLPYLEKPEGEWVFKKPDIGEIFKGIDGNTFMADKQWCQTKPSRLQGYRWVKTPEVAPDVTPEVENSAEVSGFVEYPIFKADGRYWCNVLHLNGERWDYECALYELPSLVGFAGVQFDGQNEICEWNMAVVMFIQSDGMLFDYEYLDENNRLKPATPIKARFWIKTPPLNDK